MIQSSIVIPRPRIAVPVPNSEKPEYSERSLPSYQAAVEQAGGEAVIIDLTLAASEIAQRVRECDAVLLPGSPADIDPQKYGEPRHPKTAVADTARDTVDNILLHDAFQSRKPVLGICYGLQALNVWRRGTLLQDIDAELQTPIRHEAGAKVREAHEVEVDSASRLAAITSAGGGRLIVNSSHHQSAKQPGDGLKIVARCPQDGVIEALEGAAGDHFVLAVQWHPERTADADGPSRAIFRTLIEEATAWRARNRGQEHS